MTQLRTVLLLTIVLATQPLRAQDSGVLTLDHAIAIALENNLTLKNAGLEIEKARDKVAVNRTRRLPSFNSYTLGSRQLSHIDLNFERGALGVLEGVGPIPAEDTTIRSPGRFSVLMINEVTQPISQLHRIGLGIRSAERSVDAQEEQLRADRHSVIAQLKAAYYSILQTQSSFNAAEQNIRLYRELDRVTEHYVLQRVSLKSESLEVKTRLAKAQLDLLTIEDRLVTQKEQLNALLGRDLRTEFSVDLMPEAEVIKVDLPQAHAIALSQRPEIRKARLKAEQAELERRMKRSEFIPEISLSFSHTSPINYSSVLPKTFTTVGVAMNWEIFDWGRKKKELASTDRAIQQADNTIREMESTVLREVNATYRTLQRTGQSLRIAMLSQDTAAEAMRVVSNSYKVSAALLKDVLQSEAAVAQADDQYQQALLAFWIAKSEFDKSLGEDHE
jgi:outer membrane protein TolC